MRNCMRLPMIIACILILGCGLSNQCEYGDICDSDNDCREYLVCGKDNCVREFSYLWDKYDLTPDRTDDCCTERAPWK